jgi:hypothetical protein
VPPVLGFRLAKPEAHNLAGSHLALDGYMWVAGVEEERWRTRATCVSHQPTSRDVPVT